MSKPVLICGLGSIGRRHMRNLQAIGHHQIILYRTGKSTLPADELAGLPAFSTMETALTTAPAAAIISNPSALHMPTALQAARAGCHVLIEKPISHNMDGVQELAKLVQQQNIQVLVGFQFRFHPGLRRIKQWLAEKAIGRVVSVQAHWGEYLPNWHPWEDYHQSYSARRELGGGVILTLCHPFDYLRWLFGKVSTVSATITDGGLDIPVEDTADVHLQFASGVLGHVHLDYIQRPPAHWLHIVGRRGTIRWGNADGTACLYRSATHSWETFPMEPDFERNALFMAEMRHFLECVAGRETPYATLTDGIQVLKIALAAKQAALEQRTIPV